MLRAVDTVGGKYRPQQEEALDWIAGSDAEYKIVHMGTGSGKSVVALDIDAHRELICTTDRMQSMQYESYGLDYVAVVYGKNNYHCACNMFNRQNANAEQLDAYIKANPEEARAPYPRSLYSDDYVQYAEKHMAEKCLDDDCPHPKVSSCSLKRKCNNAYYAAIDSAINADVTVTTIQGARWLLKYELLVRHGEDCHKYKEHPCCDYYSCHCGKEPPFDIIIIDEAHKAYEAIMDSSCKIRYETLDMLGLDIDFRTEDTEVRRTDLQDIGIWPSVKLRENQLPEFWARYSGDIKEAAAWHIQFHVDEHEDAVAALSAQYAASMADGSDKEEASKRYKLGLREAEYQLKEARQPFDELCDSLDVVAETREVAGLELRDYGLELKYAWASDGLYDRVIGQYAHETVFMSGTQPTVPMMKQYYGLNDDVERRLWDSDFPPENSPVWFANRWMPHNTGGKDAMLYTPEDGTSIVQVYGRLTADRVNYELNAGRNVLVLMESEFELLGARDYEIKDPSLSKAARDHAVRTKYPIDPYRGGPVEARDYDGYAQIFAAMYPQHIDKLVVSGNGQLRKKLPEFDAMGGPKVMMATAAHTGTDMDYVDTIIIPRIHTAYEYGYIADLRRELARDRNYEAYEQLMWVSQAAGRGTRSTDSECVTYVLDSALLSLVCGYQARGVLAYDQRCDVLGYSYLKARIGAKMKGSKYTVGRPVVTWVETLKRVKRMRGWT